MDERIKARIEKSQRSRKHFKQASVTDPTGAQNTQVGKIIGDYRAHGTRPRITASQPLYGDFRSSRHLQDMQEAYQSAAAHFGLLPASVRDVADNNMIKYVQMVESGDEATLQLLVDAGLQIEGFEPSVPSGTDREPLPSPAPAQPDPPAPAEPSGTPAAEPRGD